MTAAENKELVARMIEEVWNQGDASAISRYDAPEIQDEVRRHHSELMEAFSDVHVTVNDMIGEGDKVAVRLMVSGTHDRGPFAGQPPSGRRLSWGSFRFFRLDGDTIVETWAMQDRLGLMQQLGVIRPLDDEVHWADGATG